MSRYDYRSLSPAQRRQFLDRLSEVITTFDEPKQVRFFLERLLTESEVVMLARRLQVAELLVSGRTYEQIQRQLGVGMSTIQSVDRWLTDAAHEYRLIREEQKQALEAAKRQQGTMKRRPGTMPGTLQHLIRHDDRFILFRLLLGDF
jgi:TrpR-related protein YerC/YecD